MFGGADGSAGRGSRSTRSDGGVILIVTIRALPCFRCFLVCNEDAPAIGKAQTTATSCLFAGTAAEADFAGRIN